MLSFRPLATLLALPLLRGAAVLVAGGRPTPVAAVGDCEISFNLFDANATNAGSVTPGGTSTLLAYPGYTNGTTVGIDISSTNPSSCSALGRSNFYALFSRWHEVLFGKSIDGAAANAELAANYGQIDHIPARYAIATQAFDYKNDFGPGYATPAAAAFDLSAAATMTLASGSEVSVYGDITRCAKKQGLTRGFAPAYVARDIAAAANGTNGIWYWLKNRVGNPYSIRRSSSLGPEIQGGGGKGRCSAMSGAAATDAIIYDSVAPVITTLKTTAGYFGAETAVVDLDTSAVTDAASPLWLMAFTNSSSCTATSGSWSAWEAYATTKDDWNITSSTYGGNGLSTDGIRTVCMRVMDRAGNIGFYKGTIALDKVDPTVASFTTTNSSPVALGSVSYKLTFSEAVYGLLSTDITNTGTLTGCTFVVSGAEGSTIYTITATDCVTGGGATGTLAPRLAAGSIYDAAGQTGPASTSTAASLTVDPPAAVTSFVLQAASDSGASNEDDLTNASTQVFDLVFSESISGFTASDISNTGTATSCAFAVSAASGTSFTVTATGCSKGTLIPTLKVGGVSDGSTSIPALAKAGVTVTIDKTLPTVEIRCSNQPTRSFSSCPATSTEATLYVRVAVSDSSTDGSSFAADAIGVPAGLGDCTVSSSKVVAGRNQEKIFACTARATYTLSVTVTDRAGNTSAATAASFILQ
jgi:hypothetical protein